MTIFVEMAHTLKRVCYANIISKLVLFNPPLKQWELIFMKAEMLFYTKYIISNGTLIQKTHKKVELIKYILQ
jgi:hypothetical protein